MSEFPLRGNLSISFGEVCDQGKVREENQDSIRSASIPLGDLFIVADGIGGYQGGAIASRMVVDGFHSQLALRPVGYAPEKALAEACTYTNASIHTAANSGDPATQRMGSTVVLALIQAGNPAGSNSGTLASFTPTAWIGHVGDSRAYLIRAGTMSKITSDHSAVQALINRNLITEEEARNHPDASVLTRSLGHRPDVEIEIDRVAVQSGDALLLCSDGLWGYVSDADIATVATDASLGVQTIADTLLHQALAAGGQDNIGIEFIRFTGDASVTLPEAPLAAQASTRKTTPVSTGWAPQADRARSNRKIQQIVAAGLLLLACGGYLAIAHSTQRWPFKRPPSITGLSAKASTGNSQTTAKDGSSDSQKQKQDQPKPTSGHSVDTHADTHSGSGHPTGDRASKDPVTHNPVPDQADNPGNTNASESTHAPPPVPDPTRKRSRGEWLVGVYGDPPQGKEEVSAESKSRFEVVYIDRNSHPDCGQLARPRTQIFTHDRRRVRLFIRLRPGIILPEAAKNSQTQDINERVTTACGEGYDMIIVKPPSAASAATNPPTLPQTAGSAQRTQHVQQQPKQTPQM